MIARESGIVEPRNSLRLALLSLLVGHVRSLTLFGRRRVIVTKGCTDVEEHATFMFNEMPIVCGGWRSVHRDRGHWEPRANAASSHESKTAREVALGVRNSRAAGSRQNQCYANLDELSASGQFQLQRLRQKPHRRPVQDGRIVRFEEVMRLIVNAISTNRGSNRDIFDLPVEVESQKNQLASTTSVDFSLTSIDRNKTALGAMKKLIPANKRKEFIATLDVNESKRGNFVYSEPRGTVEALKERESV